MISFKDFIALSENEKNDMTRRTLGSFVKKSQTHAQMHQANIEHQQNKALDHKRKGNTQGMIKAYRNADESRKVKSNIIDRLNKKLS